jgi:hypothetical protein
MQALDDIIHDIHGLHQELSRFEQRYHLLSADFYHLYKTGELEQTRDMIEWVGYYEAKLERENQYREVMYIYLRELRFQTGLGILRLHPSATHVGAS